MAIEQARNLVLVGAMGAGKSSIGRRLAARLQMDFVDVDLAVETACGTDIDTIFDCEGEAGFRRRERDALAQALSGSGCVIATGGGAVLDPGNRAAMSTGNCVVWLQVDVATQLQRLARDRTRPLLQRPDREQVLHALAAQRTPLYAQVADLAFDTRALAPDAAAEALLHRLPRFQQAGLQATRPAPRADCHLPPRPHPQRDDA